MILKKKEFLLLFFLILLQSCSGGRIGNFLESSFNDLDKKKQDDNLQTNLINKKNEVLENKEINDENYEKTKKVEKQNYVMESKKNVVLENKEINDENYEKTKKVEKQNNDIENKKNKNLDKLQKQKSKKIKNFSKKRNIERQSYKIIFILKDVDPKDPTEKLSTILSNSDVNFEIEKIERIFDSQNKSMNKN